MKVRAFVMLLVGVAVVSGLTEKEDQVVTDLLKVLKRGTSMYPLEEMFHQFAEVMGFSHTAARLNRWSPAPKAAYATIYDMLMYVDTNGKHTPEQRKKLQELIDIVGTKVLKQGSRLIDAKTVVLQEVEEDEDSQSTGGADSNATDSANEDAN
ncbi:hypothetical protein GQ54DRAFT_314951 [Martensiomyces pterosporus]|nr:hypothetical protein GQ54DRAFT_314951 [Martensiomyces pterosporus]